MQNAMRNEGRRALEAAHSVTGNGARRNLYETVPGKDRLTVPMIPEKTQSVAAPDSNASTTRLLASMTNSFVAEPLLDTEQAAAIMRIHPKTLQKLARRGVIRALQIGKVWRFRASVLDEWIEQQLAG